MIRKKKLLAAGMVFILSCSTLTTNHLCLIKADAKDLTPLNVLDLSKVNAYTLGDAESATSEVITKNNTSYVHIDNPSIGGAFTTLDVKPESGLWKCSNKTKISASVKNPNKYLINVRMKVFDSDGNCKVFLKDIPAGESAILNAVNYAEGDVNDKDTLCFGGPVNPEKISKISILVFELPLQKDGIESCSLDVYDISITGPVELAKPEKINNNPKDEVLIDHPDYLPLSDSDNTRKWKLSETLSDEFEGTKLDSNKWTDYHRFWAGRQPSCFDEKNVSVSDGKLILQSQWEDTPTDRMIAANKTLSEGAPKYQDISTSCVQSKNTTGYGYYEIKAKTAPISISSSFWFRNPQLNPVQEIDVFEQVGRPANYNLAKNGSDYPMNTHYVVNGADVSNPMLYNTGIDLTSDYHIYGLEWDENYLRFYIDGTLIHEMNNQIEKKIYQPQYILFDMETLIYGCAAPKKEDFAYNTGERNPSAFEIDYFRAWRSDVPQSEEPMETAVQKKNSINKQTTAIKGSPVIEHDIKTVDPIWEKATAIDDFVYKRGDKSIPIHCVTKTMWDENYLYIYNKVTDPEIYINDIDEFQESDNTELYIDELNENTPNNYDSNDYCIKIYPDGQIVTTPNTPKDIITNAFLTSDGYITQYKLPWNKVTPELGKKIGFDLQVNQASKESDTRDAIIGWNDPTNNTWKTLEHTGEIKLVESTVSIESNDIIDVTNKDDLFYDKNDKKVVSSLVRTNYNHLLLLDENGLIVKTDKIMLPGINNFMLVNEKGFIFQDKTLFYHGNKYQTDKDGKVITSSIVHTNSGHLAYAQNDGSFAKGRKIILPSGQTVFASKTRALYTNCTFKLPSGIQYSADENGFLTQLK